MLLGRDIIHSTINPLGKISGAIHVYDERSFFLVHKGSTSCSRSAATNALIVGIDPTPVISLGGTDARLWRYKDLPAKLLELAIEPTVFG